MNDDFISVVDETLREWAKLRKSYLDTGRPELAGYVDAGISLISYIRSKAEKGEATFTADQLFNFFKITI